MENGKEELSELKVVYDELWADAKTLVKDMKKSIAIYLYAGYTTLIISATSILSSIPFFLRVAVGAADLFTWFFVILEIIASVVVISFAARLFKWYKSLAKKYSKLIELEKHWRKPNAQTALTI